jgi:hypothetical protein
MRPRTHLWTSALAAAIVYPRSPLRAALAIASGVLIDLDHLALYRLRTGDGTLTGAMVYNRYRNFPARRGDNRPRYGSMRSWIHEPAVLPPLLLLARHVPALRPIALGMFVHLLLDQAYMTRAVRVALRARGRCELCGARGRPLRHHFVRHPLEGGTASVDNIVALCRPCYRRARASYPIYPPPPVEAAP